MIQIIGIFLGFAERTGWRSAAVRNAAFDVNIENTDGWLKMEVSITSNPWKTLIGCNL
jgi:hypothetical protein